MSVVIDSHAHLIDRTVPGYPLVADKWGGARWGGGVDDLIQQMDEAGIDYAFLLTSTIIDVMEHFPPASRDDILISFDPYITKACYWRDWASHEDRFFLFSDSIDPRVPGYVDRAAQDLDRGASGLKMLPAFANSAIDEPCWEPIFQLLSERQKACIIDLSYWYLHFEWFAPRLYEKYKSYEDFAQTVHHIANKYPDVRMEITHYGTPILRAPERRGANYRPESDKEPDIDYDALQAPIEMIKPHPNLFCGLSAYQHMTGRNEDYPYWSALRIVEILVDGLGADRVIFGTDWPYIGDVGYLGLIRAIREAPFLDEAEADMILGDNAWRLLRGNSPTSNTPASNAPGYGALHGGE